MLRYLKKKQVTKLLVELIQTVELFFSMIKKIKSNVNSNAFMTQKATYIGYFVA